MMPRKYLIHNGDLVIEILMRPDFDINHPNQDEIIVIESIIHIIVEELRHLASKQPSKSNPSRRALMNGKHSKN